MVTVTHGMAAPQHMATPNLHPAAASHGQPVHQEMGSGSSWISTGKIGEKEISWISASGQLVIVVAEA